MSRRIRTLREFAEDEITLPEGPHAGRRFRCSRQPFSGLLFDQMQTWRRVAVTGTVQSGKSLCAFVIPVLSHVFERRENIIMAGPTVELLNDKFQREVLPVINRNPEFRELMPTEGRGSRGGRIESITFKHGPTIKYMSGGGGDEKRSSYTARVLIIIEADKMDETSEISREADKVSQLEARTAAFGDDARVILECTASFKSGRIWREYTGGTETKIVCPCPHCHAYVSPGRDDFRGWETAGNEVDAAKLAAFFCPSCGEALNDRERKSMNAAAKLLHRGQVIDQDGAIHGDAPPVMTLGFRWSAFHNLLWSTSYLGVKSWRLMRSEDEDSAERESSQFVGALPHEPRDTGDATSLTVETVVERQTELPRGHVPKDAEFVTMGLDIGKRLCHWVAMFFRPDCTAGIHDYGRIECAADDLGFERAVVIALKDFHERVETNNWTCETYHRVLVDARWKPDTILAAIKALGDRRWMPAMGLGHSQYSKRQYTHPDKVGGSVVRIGHRFFDRIRRMSGGTRLVMMDSNYWKSQLHDRLALPFDKEELKPSKGGIGLFSSLDVNEHLAFGKHLTAEREVVRFEAGRGYTKTWETLRENNHWLDAAYMAIVAGYHVGFRFDPLPTTRAAVVGGVEPHRDDGYEFVAPTFLHPRDQQDNL